MLTDSFEYRDQARSPATYFALGAAMAAAYLTQKAGLPELHQVLSVLFIGIVLWRIVVNPICGFRLSAQGLDCFEGRFRRSVRLRDIDSVTIYEAADEGTRCILNLRVGDRMALPGAEHFGVRRLTAEFGRLGVPVLF